MSERDPKVSSHYRDLPREEPARPLDDAILAASRRALQRRKWHYPAAAAAAVVMLAVAVTFHVEREKPVFKEEVAQADRAAPKAAPEPEPRIEVPKKTAPVFVPDPKPSAPSAGPARELARRDAAGAAADQRQERAEVAQAPAAAAARPQAAAPAPEMRAREAERPLAALQLDEAPLPWLERIARLRQEGKHDEADRALAEFRNRYPSFKIPEETLKRVEKR